MTTRIRHFGLESRSAIVILERLSALGVTVTPLPDGDLHLEGVSAPPPALLELVKQHKAELLACLGES